MRRSRRLSAKLSKRCVHHRVWADSPSVIVSDEDEPSARMRHMMEAMGQKGMPEQKPILETNLDHEIVRKLLADPALTRYRMRPGYCLSRHFCSKEWF